MAVSEVLQICPSVENLCDSTKGRPKSSVKNNIKKVYHCPIETCKYFKNENYFEKIKFLKQHFIKVHKTKSFTCEKCSKHFPLESTLNRHKLMCGVSYRCYCSAEYNAYEALITHVKRKHRMKTLKYKDMMECLKVHSTAWNVQKSFDNLLKLKAIIVQNPNQQKLLVLKEKKPKMASCKETQTSMKMCRILPNINSQVQNTKEQNIMKTVSMQTVIELGNRKRKKIKHPGHNTINSFTKNTSFHSSSTQTTPIKENYNMKYNITKFPEICKCDVNKKIIKMDFPVSLHEIYENSKNKKESCPVHFTMQPTDFEDNSNNSNSSNKFIEERMISVDDPNLGSIPLYNTLCKDKTYLTEKSTYRNVADTFINDNLKKEFNLIMNSDCGIREVSGINLNVAEPSTESNLIIFSNLERQINSSNDINNLDSLEDDPLQIKSNLIMYSDSETQTMFDDYFDSSYMDTYTQTCDSLLSDLDFVDIETQTSWSIFDETIKLLN